MKKKFWIALLLLAALSLVLSAGIVGFAEEAAASADPAENSTDLSQFATGDIRVEDGVITTNPAAGYWTSGAVIEKGAAIEYTIQVFDNMYDNACLIYTCLGNFSASCWQNDDYTGSNFSFWWNFNEFRINDREQTILSKSLVQVYDGQPHTIRFEPRIDAESYTITVFFDGEEVGTLDATGTALEKSEKLCLSMRQTGGTGAGGYATISAFRQILPESEEGFLKKDVLPFISGDVTYTGDVVTTQPAAAYWTTGNVIEKGAAFEFVIQTFDNMHEQGCFLFLCLGNFAATCWQNDDYTGTNFSFWWDFSDIKVNDQSESLFNRLLLEVYDGQKHTIRFVPVIDASSYGIDLYFDGEFLYTLDATGTWLEDSDYLCLSMRQTGGSGGYAEIREFYQYVEEPESGEDELVRSDLLPYLTGDLTVEDGVATTQEAGAYWTSGAVIQRGAPFEFTIQTFDDMLGKGCFMLLCLGNFPASCWQNDDYSGTNFSFWWDFGDIKINDRPEIVQKAMCVELFDGNEHTLRFEPEITEEAYRIAINLDGKYICTLDATGTYLADSEYLCISMRQTGGSGGYAKIWDFYQYVEEEKPPVEEVYGELTDRSCWIFGKDIQSDEVLMDEAAGSVTVGHYANGSYAITHKEVLPEDAAIEFSVKLAEDAGISNADAGLTFVVVSDNDAADGSAIYDLNKAGYSVLFRFDANENVWIMVYKDGELFLSKGAAYTSVSDGNWHAMKLRIFPDYEFDCVNYAVYMDGAMLINVDIDDFSVIGSHHLTLGGWNHTIYPGTWVVKNLTVREMVPSDTENAELNALFALIQTLDREVTAENYAASLQKAEQIRAVLAQHPEYEADLPNVGLYYYVERELAAYDQRQQWMQEAKAVEDRIRAISYEQIDENNFDSVQAALSEAETAYDALCEEARAYVTNYARLAQIKADLDGYEGAEEQTPPPTDEADGGCNATIFGDVACALAAGAFVVGALWIVFQKRNKN